MLSQPKELNPITINQDDKTAKSPDKRCVFCDIVAGTEPSIVIYQDDDVLVFRNRLRWVPIMLLAIPKVHMTQDQLWSSMIVSKVASVAARIGRQECPKGYRLLSNFGHDAMQSVEHGHIHILGGIHLGPYA